MEFFNIDKLGNENYEVVYMTNDKKFKIHRKCIVPNVFKIWNNIVVEKFPNLKCLSPRAQDLQTFRKIKNDLTIKQEINDAHFNINKDNYKNYEIVKYDMTKLIANYLTKYNTGLNVKQVKKMIKEGGDFLLKGMNFFNF